MNPRWLAPSIVILLLGSAACGNSAASPPVPTPSPRAVPTMTAADNARLAQLEARPLKLPPLAADGTCPRGQLPIFNPYRDGSAASGPLYGAGPVYMHGGAKTTTSQSDYFDATFFTGPAVAGVVLLRGQQIDGGHKVVFVGPYATGSVVGTDTILGESAELRGELALPAERPPTNPAAAAGWGIWSVRFGIDRSVATSAVNCFGLQVDGDFGTEVMAGP